ncbi:uncharacterized protein LOC143571005 [Bidens hawaiensis]|uniref:uncharacterized protein LOC143571005 n=1 Tax=Bidens hawaiensis TaxID=980011 RepID=UPI0040498246
MKNAFIKKYFGNTPKSSIETPSSSPYASENNNKRSREEVEVSEDEIVEYSASKDAAFCLWCYLFPTGNRHGDEVFINHGFRNWKKEIENFRDHEGGQNSRHNHARVQFELFKDQRHNLDNVLSQQCKQDEIVYRVRLTAVVDVIRFLLKQGLAFRGHDESISSNSRGNFIELVKWYCERNDEVNKAFNSKSHGNNQLTSPKIQKEIVNACAAEVRKIIVNEIKDKFFSILIDKSRDCSIKEQMAVVLRYVDDVGEVIERFVGVVHVTDTCASSLKSAIDNFFAKNNLTMSKVRGQGYDGASNMRGELNGLKQKILAEKKCAFYIHCFAHQLQLQLVVVATSSEYASERFDSQKQHDDFVKRIETGEVCTGKGKNQEMSLARAGDTRWGSHLKTILRLLDLWKPVREVLIALSREGIDAKTRGIALGMAEKMENFEFVFIAHLMVNLLRKTNDLSQALQLKNQNIGNAVRLIEDMKYDIKKYRDDGWEELMNEVTTFCSKNEINMPNMEDLIPGRVKRTIDDEPQTYLHRFRADIFYQVVDLLLNEMNEHFTKANSELLTCIACLDPRDSFQTFDREKLLRLAKLYSDDFSGFELGQLRIQHDRYISNMKSNEVFFGLHDIENLQRKWFR